LPSRRAIRCDVSAKTCRNMGSLVTAHRAHVDRVRTISRMRIENSGE
jgi:hypothetical protein